MQIFNVTQIHQTDCFVKHGHWPIDYIASIRYPCMVKVLKMRWIYAHNSVTRNFLR